MSTDKQPSYRRSTGSPRGVARREALLAAVTDDLAANGLADFSLRRAAAAAGTTHKVLLYHFDGMEALLAEVMKRLRQRRIDNVMSTVADKPTLAERVAGIWPVLADDASGLRVIDQAIGLAMYDPDRYAHLAREATQMYRDPLLALCPDGWAPARKTEVVELITATFRGCLMEWQTARDDARIAAALRALTRALEAEERRDG